MKKQELINICYKYLAGAFDRGLCCNRFDADNSNELLSLHLKVAPDLVDELLSLQVPVPDEKEGDEINPYLLTGKELERAVEKRKSNHP